MWSRHVVFLLLVLLASAAGRGARGSDTPDCIAQLRGRLDEAGEEVVDRVGRLATPRALQTLIECYPLLLDPGMRKRTVEAIGLYLEGENPQLATRSASFLLERLATSSSRSVVLAAREGLSTVALDDATRYTLRASFIEEADPIRRLDLLMPLTRHPAAEDQEFLLEVYRGSVDAWAAGHALLGLARLRKQDAASWIREAYGTGDVNLQYFALSAALLGEIPLAEDLAVDAIRGDDHYNRDCGFRLLAACAGPSGTKRLLDIATGDRDPALRQAAEHAFTSIQKKSARQWIRDEALHDSRARVRGLALRAVVGWDDDQSAGDILEALSDPVRSVREVALAAIGRFNDPRAIQGTRGILASAPPDDLVLVLGSLSAGAIPPDRLSAMVAPLARHRSPRAQAAALNLLRLRGAVVQGETLDKALRSTFWAVRSAAIDSIVTSGEREHIPRLIEALARERRPRLVHDLRAALCRMTGALPGKGDAGDWKEWWRSSTADPRHGSERPAPRPFREPEDLPRFFGIPVCTETVSFVVALGYPRARGGVSPQALLVRTKRELLRTIADLAESVRFNVCFLAESGGSWKKAPARATRKNRSGVLGFVRANNPIAGAGWVRGLDAAMSRGDVDTLFFAAAGGSTEDPETARNLRSEIRRLNLSRSIRIHTISIGQDSELLRWIARDSGGTYRRQL